jgi:hypothetical protein
MNQGINLARDERWDGWLKNSFDYFQEIASAIRLDSQVPEDVINRLR